MLQVETRDSQQLAHICPRRRRGLARGNRREDAVAAPRRAESERGETVRSSGRGASPLRTQTLPLRPRPRQASVFNPCLFPSSFSRARRTQTAPANPNSSGLDAGGQSHRKRPPHPPAPQAAGAEPSLAFSALRTRHPSEVLSLHCPPSSARGKETAFGGIWWRCVSPGLRAHGHPPEPLVGMETARSPERWDRHDYSEPELLTTDWYAVRDEEKVREQGLRDRALRSGADSRFLTRKTGSSKAAGHYRD